MHSIRFKITAITVGAILTTILCVFLASYCTIQSETDRMAVGTMNLIGQDTQKSVEKYTESVEQSTEMIGGIASDMLNSTVLVDGGIVGSTKKDQRTPEQTAQIDAYLAEYCTWLQDEFATVGSHTRGVVTYYYCIAPDISASVRGFYYSKVGKTGFNRQEPIDASQLDPGDTEENAWYYTSIARGRPSWIGPYTAKSLHGIQICSYVVPIYKSGTLIGVLGMDIPLNILVSQVRTIKVYDTGFACLLDEDGRVIYHPDLPYGSTLDTTIDIGVLRQENSGDELIRYTSGGQDRLFSFTTLSNGMKLAIVVPAAEVNASSILLTRVIADIAIATTTVFSVIILLLIRYITNPLQRLTVASYKLAMADYDVELDYKGKDEVGALTNAFTRMRDQLQADMEDLNRKANFDDLTGLPNQRHFFDLALVERDRMVGCGENPAMLYFNLVGMKNFNRQYGFGEGDRLICVVAEILANQFGRHRTSRIGQDQFAAMTDEEYVEEALSAVFAACRKADEEKMLPLSVGIYLNSLEPVDMSIACDRAKYACDQRRGSYVSGFRYYDADMLKQVEVVRHVINNLDRALGERWVKVYYQPIIRTVNGNVCDEEALARWIDPVRGMLSPTDFVPVLENAGLIYKLDLYVLDCVLEKMEAHRQSGLAVVPHSINLSRSDFDSCDIVEEIRRRVDAAGFERSSISIEITESIIGRDFDFMKKQVRRFQDLGFPVWMDDFGSGYSSLDALQSIEFDLLKFDMSFMRKYDEGNSGRIILTDLMKMANALGVDTICEGVETEAQYRFLQEIGCSKVQGFYFCMPIPAAKIAERHSKGIQIGYENPEESKYYASLGRVNLYDPGVITSEEEGGFQNYLNSFPMAVLEVADGVVRIARCNKPYREFLSRVLGVAVREIHEGRRIVDDQPDEEFMDAMAHCRKDGEWTKIVGKPNGGTATVHSYLRRLATNPVTGAEAYALVVFSMMHR